MASQESQSAQILQYVEILNRLKRATCEGRLLWERAGSDRKQFAAPLEAGHRASAAESPDGKSVLFTMTNPQGVQTLSLDTSRIADDVLRLALLQLFVTVRDSLIRHNVTEALDAVNGL